MTWIEIYPGSNKAWRATGYEAALEQPGTLAQYNLNVIGN